VATILFMKDATLTLKVGAGVPAEFNGDCSSVAIEVTPGDEVQYPTLDGEVASNVGPASYALAIVAGQDWTATGLARFLWDNDGQTADYVYNAHGKDATPTADTPGVSGQVRIVAGSYGGEVGTFAEVEVSLPCLARPVLTTA
jgi:hypothetical protein